MSETTESPAVDFARYLEEKAVGELGVDIHVARQPHKPDSCICINKAMGRLTLSAWTTCHSALG